MRSVEMFFSVLHTEKQVYALWSVLHVGYDNSIKKRKILLTRVPSAAEIATVTDPISKSLLQFWPSPNIANAAAGSSRKQVGKKGGKSPSYADWSKEDLVKRAREIGVKGRSTMTKAQLIKALRNH